MPAKKTSLILLLLCAAGASAAELSCKATKDCTSANEFYKCVEDTCQCPAGGGTDIVLDVLLPVLVILLMYGMGCAIFLDELVHYVGVFIELVKFRKPSEKQVTSAKPLLVGMLSQFGVMPLVAFTLGYIFELSPTQHIGVIIIGCTPGGTTSNLFAYWANGDTALSISMTTASTTLAIVFQLLLIKLYTDSGKGSLVELAENTGAKLSIPYADLIKVLLAVMVPVALGIYTRARSYKYAQWGTRIGTWSGAFVVILAIVYGSVTQSHLWTDSDGNIWGVCICMGLAGFGFGYAVSAGLGMSRRVSRTVALETGIQNGPLAIAIVQLSFQSDPCTQSSMLVFPLFYSVWIVIESIVFALVLRKIPLSAPALAPNENQSYIMPEDGVPEGGRVRRSLIVKDGALHTTGAAGPDVRTLFDNFESAALKFPRRRCLGRRAVKENGDAAGYVFDSYATVRSKSRLVGHFIAKEVGIARGGFVGLFSINRPEWVWAEQACNAFSFCSVPLYDTLGAEAVQYIIQQTKMPVIVCSSNKVGGLLELIEAGSASSLKAIIHMDDEVDDDHVDRAKKAGVELRSINSCIERAVGSMPPAAETPKSNNPFSKAPDQLHVAAEQVEISPPGPEDLAIICYTSGTTGVPKGAMISHGNMLAMSAATDAVDIGLTEEDVHISYLPLAHAFERMMHAMLLGKGASIGYFRGDVKQLLEDVVELHPTIFASVPRLLNRIYDRVNARMDKLSGYECCTPNNFFPPPAMKKWMFNKGFRVKTELLKKNVFEEGFWDSSVFSAVQRLLGGRVRYIITGSAPIHPDVLSFLRVVFACNVHEGYGQTECTAACTVTLPSDCSAGHVGPPLPTAEVKLVSVPEMGYTVEDESGPRGEVCIRGPTVFKGYFEDDEKTKEAFASGDDWLHTGDIGMWLPDGTLKIVDRKKNIFKLAQGEYVAPEKVENVYMKSKFVAQSFVHGDSLQHCLVAVIVPDRDALFAWADENNVDTDTDLKEVNVDVSGSEGDGRFSALCARDETREMIIENITSTGKTAGLKGFELARAIKVESKEFSVDDGLVTPTFKLKRPALLRHFRADVDAMYETVGSGGAIPAAAAATAAPGGGEMSGAV